MNSIIQNTPESTLGYVIGQYLNNASQRNSTSSQPKLETTSATYSHLTAVAEKLNEGVAASHTFGTIEDHIEAAVKTVGPENRAELLVFQGAVTALYHTPEEAKTYFRKAVAEDPTAVNQIRKLGSVLYVNGHETMAQTYFDFASRMGDKQAREFAEGPARGPARERTYERMKEAA